MEILCRDCGKITRYSNARPDECSYCFVTLAVSAEISSDIPPSNQSVIIGLTLIYQTNQQKISVPALGETILGRRNHGHDVLSEILFNGTPVISKRHCSIVFNDNRFVLRDEGSANGTFYGPEKLDCAESPRIIEDRGRIYLGKEEFAARFENAAQQEQVTTFTESSTDSTAFGLFRCNNCGLEMTGEKTMICPECTTYDSFYLVNPD